jgi:hypothetical protein
MFRRWVRIFCLGVLIVLLGTAVMAQFWHFDFQASPAHVLVDQSGVLAASIRRWMARDVHMPRRWSASDLLGLPGGRVMSAYWWSVFCPWWLLIAAWSLVTAGVWWLTRRRKVVGGAFPVEPAANSTGGS